MVPGESVYGEKRISVQVRASSHHLPFLRVRFPIIIVQYGCIEVVYILANGFLNLYRRVLV
uniref:Uncharacterized protein n=1 Tax=Arundo donax TaxID=35708 RepID=A0A0A8ZYE4_ARUDO